jgi:succinoglycan biosynthesis protein ExoM
MNKFSIDICIITYQRANLLERTLFSILEFNPSATHNAGIIVIDNDKAQSAKTTVENINKSYPGLVNYYIEATKGYASARNKCIEVSEANTLIFIDDDEWVTKNWLSSLLKTQKDYDAAVVIGPVLSDLPVNTPKWIKQGGFFDRERHPTGLKMKYGWSGNALINKKKVTPKELKFDLNYGSSGGEDHELFSRLYRTGHLIVWADEAVVYEEILTEKFHPKWLIRRAFLVGKAVSQVYLSEKGWIDKTLWYTKKLAILLISMLLTPLWFLRGSGPGIRMLSRVISNIGGLSTIGARSKYS